jgi:hypothetical protein
MNMRSQSNVAMTDSRGRPTKVVLAIAAIAFGCALDSRELNSKEQIRDAGSDVGLSNPRQAPLNADASPNSNNSDLAANSGSSGEQSARDGACGPEGCLARDADAGSLSCPGCNIEDGCFAIGAANPNNVCELCDPVRDRAGWSANDGGTCDDGLFCTVEDVCVTGRCSGTARPCEDGIACNGVSVCVEAEGACSPDANQCGTLEVCNLESGRCESTCNGCTVDGVCFPSGTSPANNQCLVCDPTSSATSLTVSLGRNCGSGATECSGQDTCNALGQCAPNHLAAGAPCGIAGSPQCDAADTCDGRGECVLRVAQDGSPCNDGQFCTNGDRCLAGQCVPGGPLNCGASQSCDEIADECACNGCSIGGDCLAAGTVNPSNACQICTPAQSRNAFANRDAPGCVDGRVLRSLGQTCGASSEQCGQGVCSVGRCCEPACDNGCLADGTCECGDLLFRDGRCRLPDVVVCTQDDDCFSGVCTQWFGDFDLDGFGSPDFTVNTCGLVVPPGGPISGRSFTLLADDCCDDNPDAQSCEQCGI